MSLNQESKLTRIYLRELIFLKKEQLLLHCLQQEKARNNLNAPKAGE